MGKHWTNQALSSAPEQHEGAELLLRTAGAVCITHFNGKGPSDGARKGGKDNHSARRIPAAKPSSPYIALQLRHSGERTSATFPSFASLEPVGAHKRSSVGFRRIWNDFRFDILI